MDNYLNSIAKHEIEDFVFDESFETVFPTKGPQHRFQAILFIEKEGFNELFKAVKLAERYDLAIMSTKGQSVVAARQLVDELCHSDVPILVLHDFDKEGFLISQTLTSVSSAAEEAGRVRYEFRHDINVIDLGLRLEDIEEWNLEPESVRFKGDFDYDSIATPEEQAFLRGNQRVELNSFTSRDFITWIEGKLDEHGIKKDDGTTHDYYYSDQWQVLEERDSGSVAVRQFVWGIRYVDDLVLRDRGATLDERLYALQDANWNVVAIVGDDSGWKVLQRFAYDAYGSATELNPNFSTPYSGTVYDWEYTYTSRRLDATTGLMYYRARYYHTELGRFINRDPILYDDGSNLYEYNGGRPLDTLDPTGEYTLADARRSLAKSKGINKPRAGRGPLRKYQKQLRELKDQEVFDEWIKIERARGTGWTKQLPACPCDIRSVCRIRANYNQEAVVLTNPDPKKWDGPAGLYKPETFHPGGKWELRSLNPINGHGQQCVYDKDGYLIKSGFAAGSADWGHATTSRLAAIWGFIAGSVHIPHDVKPFNLALELDKGKHDENVKKYQSVRPTSDKPCTE